KDSSNSSKPPSSDTVRPPNPKQSGASRRHGGQPSHKGNNNIRWLKHLIFHSTAIILLSLCTGRIAIADDLTVHVSPSEGNTGTDFYWYVNYYDADGDSPDTKNVYIDDETIYEMRLDSGFPSNGTYIFGPKKLSVGSHNYYFYFTDGQGGSDQLPSIGMFSGPLVSESEVKTTVPNVVGMSQSDAESTITSAGLTVGTVTHAYSSTVPAGDVINQNPLGETLVDLNSTVDLVVSSGQQVAIYHPADLNNDYVIGDFELLDYIALFAQGQVGDFELLDTIDLWAAGHYYWDEYEQNFKPGEKP
ncbi:PASTA domain-containing protein, partial [bacterium]|nr:PASTA domain-containing protein [bacterium]